MDRLGLSDIIIKSIIPVNEFPDQIPASMYVYSFSTSSFRNKEPSLFNQLKYEKCCPREVLKTLSLCLSRDCIGGTGFQSLTSQDQFSGQPQSDSTQVENVLYNTNGPKFRTFVEPLIKSGNDSLERVQEYLDPASIAGYRLWIFFFEEIPLTICLKNAHSYYHKNIKPERKNGGDSSTSRGSRGGGGTRSDLKIDLIESNNTDSAMISDLYFMITGKALEQQFVDFQKVFSPDRFISGINEMDIDRRQTSLDTYFDLMTSGGSVNGGSLNQEFFRKNLLFEFVPEWFSKIMNLPLPRIETFDLIKLNGELQEKLKVTQELFDLQKKLKVHPNPEDFTNKYSSELQKHNIGIHKTVEDYLTALRTSITEVDAQIKTTQAFMEDCVVSLYFRDSVSSNEVFDEQKVFMEIEPLMKNRLKNFVALGKLRNKSNKMPYSQFRREYINTKINARNEFKATLKHKGNSFPLIKAHELTTSKKQPFITRKRPKKYSNLTRFGDFVVWLLSVFSEYFTSGVNTFHYLLVFIAHRVCFTFKLGLKTNVFLTGETGVGKTKIVMDLKLISQNESTIRMLSLETGKSRQTSGQSPDALTTVFHDEVPASMLVPGTVEKTDTRHEDLKRIITMPFTTTLAFEMIEDYETGEKKRSSKYSATINNFNLILGGNLPRNSGSFSIEKDSPMLRRFLLLSLVKGDSSPLKKLHERMYSQVHDKFSEEINKSDIKMSETIHILVESAITAGAIEDVDMFIPNLVFRLVFDKLETYGYQHPSDTKKIFYMDLCRTLTISYVIDLVYFSELGWFNRQTREGEPKPFDIDSIWRDVEPLLYTTFEIAIFVLVLMKEQLVECLEMNLISAIFHIVTKGMDLPLKGREAAKGIKWAQNPSTNKNDYTYVVFEGKDLNSIIDSLKHHIGNASSDRIRIAFNSLQNTFVKTGREWRNLPEENFVFKEPHREIRDSIAKKVEQKKWSKTEKKEGGEQQYTTTYQTSILNREPDDMFIREDSIGIEGVTRNFETMEIDDKISPCTECNCVGFSKPKIKTMNQYCTNCGHPENNHPERVSCKNCKELDFIDNRFYCHKCGEWFCTHSNTRCKTTTCCECHFMIHENCPFNVVCKTCNLEMHSDDRCRGKHEDLVEVMNDETGHHILRVTRDKQTGTTKVLLSTSALDSSRVSRFDEAVRSLGHKYLLGDMDIVCADPLKTKLRENELIQTLPEYCSVIKLKKTDSELCIPNFFKTDAHSSLVLDRRDCDDDDNSGNTGDAFIDDMSNEAYFRLDTDLDVAVYVNRLRKLCLLAPDQKEISPEMLWGIPFHCKKLIDKFNQSEIKPGKEEMDVNNSNHHPKTDRIYPDYLIESLKKGLSKMEDRVTENLKSFKESSVLFDNNSNSYISQLENENSMSTQFDSIISNGETTVDRFTPLPIKKMKIEDGQRNTSLFSTFN